MNSNVIPDMTLRGQDDPHGLTITPRPPTVGQLAASLRDLAERPADWWGLIRFDPAAPTRVRLDDARWLTTWPPGYRTDVHDHADTEVTTVIAGELVEVTISEAGVAERPLRANRVRVHGGGHTHELHNPGPAYAITLHATAP